jgi:hypothetical protein
VKPILFFWTEIVRPVTELVGSAVLAYPWLIAIPLAMTVCAAMALRGELNR